MATLLYDMTGPHAALGGKARALLSKDKPQFDQLQLLVEQDLGLAQYPVMSGRNGELAALFVARQINFMLEVGIDPLFVKQSSSTHTAQGVTYRDGIGIDPYVEKNLPALLEAAYETKAIETRVLRTLR